MKEKSRAIIAYLCLVILIISLIPVCYVGRFNHPTGDDYYYGADAHLAIVNGEGLFGAIDKAIDGVAYEYRNWQGTYAALFLMFLAPNVFNESAYHFVTAGIIIFLTGSIFYFLYSVLVKMLKMDKYAWLIVASIVSFVCIQNVPSQGETFFWYNGAMYYTGFFALSLFYYGLIIKLNYKDRIIPRCVIAGFLSVLMAGGNYVSLLPCMIITAILIFEFGYKKNKKMVIALSTNLFLQIIFFLISALAPGNKIRALELQGLAPIDTVIRSLIQGIKYLQAWIDITWIIGLIFLIPAFITSYKSTSIKFKYPIVFAVLAYGIFCSMSCPTFYSMNSTGPARAVAIVYYAFVVMTYGTFYYLLGWIYKKLQLKEISLSKKVSVTAYIILAVSILLIGTLNKKYDTFTTTRSIRILQSGEAEEFGNQYEQRLKVLNDETVSDAVLDGFTVFPDMLWVGDIVDDTNSSANQGMAKFYGKKTVIAVY